MVTDYECACLGPPKPFYVLMHTCCLDIVKLVIQARSASYRTDGANLAFTSMPRLWDVMEARYNKAKKGTYLPFCWLPEPYGYYDTGQYSNIEWETFQEGENEYQVWLFHADNSPFKLDGMRRLMGQKIFEATPVLIPSMTETVLTQLEFEAPAMTKHQPSLRYIRYY